MDAVVSYGLRYIPITVTGVVVLVLFTIYKLVIHAYISMYVVIIICI